MRRNLITTTVLALMLTIVGCASGEVIRDETGAVDCEAMKKKVQKDMAIYGVWGAKKSMDAVTEHCVGKETGQG